MKTLIRKALTAFALAVGFTTAATAATPVAVWDGDFTTATKSGWTIAENGNTKTDTSITIVAGQKGLLVTPDAAKAAQTVIVRYSDLARPEANNGYVLGTVSKWNVTDGNQDYVGTASVGTDGKAYGLFQTKYWHGNNVQTQAVVPQSGKFGLSYDRAVKTQLMGPSALLYSSTALKSSNDGSATFAGFTIGGMRNTVTTTNNGFTYSPAAGMVITGIAVFESTLTQAEVAAFKFDSDLTTHEATVSEGDEWAWGDLDGEWSPEVTDSSVAMLELTIEATDALFVDMNEQVETPIECYSLDVKGNPMRIKVDAEGEDLAKKTAAGVPYADWLFKTTGKVTGTFEPVFNSGLPTGYAASCEIVAGQGVRYVVTAPATAKFGSININFAGGRNSQAMVDNSKVGSLTTLIGAQPVRGTSWNDIGAQNQVDTIISKYVKTDGTVEEDAEITLTASQVNNPYTSGAAANMLITGYMDDSQSPIVQISFIPFDKYRVILYRATDSSSTTFSAAQIGTTAEDAKIYYGPTSGDETGGTTVNSTTETAWGKSDWRTGYAEGVNYIVSDVLEGSTAYIYSHKHAGRAGVAAIQIVEVGQLSIPPIDYTATIIESMDFGSIEWTPEKTMDFRDADTITLTATDNVNLGLDESFTIGTLKVVSGEDVMLSFRKQEGVTANVGTLDLSEVTEGVGFIAEDGYTACPATLSALRTTDSKITFFGDGSNGATLDYGTAWNNYTFAGHYIFDGGTHVFQNACETGSAMDFGANATTENPTFWVKNQATLTFKSRNPCGYNNKTANTNGIIRIGKDSKVVLQNSVAGTWYWAQQFYFEDQACLEIGTEGDNFRIVGGDTEGAPQFYLPEGNASISGLANNYLVLPGNASSGVAFDVGAGARLTLDANLKTLVDNKTFAKHGAGALQLSGDMSAFTPAFKVTEGTLRLYLANSVFTNKFEMVNDGTIEVASGTMLLMPGTFEGTIVETEDGKVIFGYTVGVNDCGKFALPEGKTADQVALFDAGGNPVAATFNEATQKFEFAWDVTGKNCWWDYEFEGNGNNVGTEGTALSWDGGRPFKDNEYVTDETTGEKSLHIPARPWRNVSSWPTTATFVMYGTMVKDANKYYVVFGSTTAGTKNTVFLATDDIDNSKVVLCRANGSGDGATVTKLCTMTVPNATTAKHLYAFVLKTDDTQSVIDIYLDGELLQEYPFGEAVTLGSGFQIASPHGGEVKGYARPANDDPATLDWLRVYNTELSQEALEKYAVEYPYVSPNGSYQRTVTAGDVWTAENAWTKEGATPELADVPAAGSTVKLTVEGATTLGVNLDADVSYEAIKINGDDLTVALATGEQSGKVISAGRVTANANVTFKYDAFTMFNAPLTVKAGKTVTFDLSMVDMTKFFTTQTYDLTGYTTLEEDATITYTAPAQLYGREITAAIDETTKHYILTVTVPEKEFTYDNGTWKWGDDQVVDGVTVSNNTALAINVKGGTLEWGMDRASFTVKVGTLKATAAATAPCAVTVWDGATFDLNGTRTGTSDNTYVVTLEGGKLANTAEGLGIVKSLTLTDDSEIALTTGSIAIQSHEGGWGATTLDLDEGNTLTLTKEGDSGARLELVSTTVTGEGTIDVQSGTLWTQENNDYRAALIKLSEDGVFEVRKDKTATVGTIEAEEGAQIIVHGTISAFTLKGTAMLANEGTYGKITLDDATIDVGQNRGFALEGSGTVNAQLTQAEMDAAVPITLFTTTTGDFDVVLTDDAGNKLEEGTDYTIYGGVVTPAQKAITFTVAAPENASVAKVATNGVELTAPYKVLPDTTVTVTYTANAGYLFENGTDTMDAEITVSEAGEQPAPKGTETTEAEAKIGTTYYLTFKAAVEEAADKAEIELCKDVSLTESIRIDKEVTFNLAEKTITAQFAQVKASYVAPIFVTTNGNLTVTGNGTVAGYTGEAAAALDGKSLITVDAGKLFFVNGTLTAGGVGSDGMYGIYVLGDGAVTTGTTGEEGGPTITTWFAAIGANNTTAPVTILINGGTYTAQANGADQWWNYFCAPIYASADGTYTINGGTFNGNYCLSTRYANTQQTIAFNGGTFNAPLLVQEEKGEGSVTERVVTKAAELTIGLPEGYFWKNDTTLAKISDEAEAKIGTTYYLTLKKAVEEAVEGDTITLVKDITTTEWIRFNENLSVTLDMNGKTISSASDECLVMGLATAAQLGTGTLTITGDGSVIQTYTGTDADVVWARHGNVVISNGYFEVNGTYQCVYSTSRSKVEIYGGTFKNLTGGDVLNVNNAGETTDILCFGGSFSKDPSLGDDAMGGTFVAQGYESVVDDDLWTVQKKQGPIPASGSEAEITPEPGVENGYNVTPTGESKEIVLDGVKDDDTLIIEAAKVDQLAFNAGVTPKIVVKNEWGTIIPNGAFYGFSDNVFNATLNPDGEVEGVKVRPTIATSEETPTPFEVGEDVTTTIKAIPGLTYTLKRGTELGTYQVEADSVTARDEDTTVTLTDDSKPTDKAFYVIQVTK